MTRLHREVSILAMIFTFAVGTAGAITWAQYNAGKTCEAKGPTRCSMAAIRAW